MKVSDMEDRFVLSSFEAPGWLIRDHREALQMLSEISDIAAHHMSDDLRDDPVQQVGIMHEIIDVVREQRDAGEKP